jgi:hypothetical protein
MNDIQDLKDQRAVLIAEIEKLKQEIPSLETALETPEVINNGRESDVKYEIRIRNTKISSREHHIHLLNQKLHRREALANRETLMAGYIADIANWMADELNLQAKRESLSTRLEEIRKRAQEDIASARRAETEAATSYAQAVAWGDIEGEKTANADAQKAAKNLAIATEQLRRQQLIITALEQELVIVDQHISEAQTEQNKIENTAMHLAYNVLEEKWNEAAKELLEVGGKLYAAARLIDRDAVSLHKLEIPEQGENFGSWQFRDLANRVDLHPMRELLSM